MFMSIRGLFAALCSLLFLIAFTTSVAQCAHQVSDGQMMKKRGINDVRNIKRGDCNPCCSDCPVQRTCDPFNDPPCEGWYDLFIETKLKKKMIILNQ